MLYVRYCNTNIDRYAYINRVPEGTLFHIKSPEECYTIGNPKNATELIKAIYPEHIELIENWDDVLQLNYE